MLATRFLRSAASTAPSFALALAGSLASVACGSEFSLGPSDGGADASTDDGSSGDAAASVAYCDALGGSHILCDDFEKGDTKGPWDGITSSTATDISIDGAFGNQSARSLLTRTTRAIESDLQASVLAKSIKTSNGNQAVVVHFDLFVDAFGGEDGGMADRDFAVLAEFLAGPLTVAFAIPTASSLTVTESLGLEGGPPRIVAHPASHGLTAMQWQHVDLALSLARGAAAPHVSVKLDGQLVVDSDLTAVTPATDMTFEMGLALFNATIPWRLHYDNVVIDRQ